MNDKVVCVLCARNEERYLENTLKSLQSQTIPVKIVLVNDGSQDNTLRIANTFNCEVINLPSHNESYVGRPELAKIWNYGLNKAKTLNPKYILILGADHMLPKTYLERLLERMNDDIVIANGRIEGDKFSPDNPIGSGEIIKTAFWNDYELLYPISYGWESWIMYRALMDGKKCVRFYDIVSSVQRQTDMGREKCYYLGKKMQALGYYWVYTLVRCLAFFIRSPLSGIWMMRGWFDGRGEEKLEIAGFVREIQKNKIKERLLVQRRL